MFKKLTEFSPSKGHVYSLCILSDGRLGSGSSDSTIKIINQKNYEIDITIASHTHSVLCITPSKDNKLISSSSDKTIKVFKISQFSYALLATLEGHSNWVWKVVLTLNNLIASCSWDNTIKIWEKEEPKKTFNCNCRSLLSLRCKNSLVSGNDSGALKFWNVDSLSCEHEMEKIRCFGCDGLFEKDSFLYVSGKEFLTIVDVLTYQVVSEVKNQCGFYGCVCDVPESIVFGGTEGSINVGLSNTLQFSTLIKSAHKDYIKSIAYLGENIIGSTSNDNTIKIWKIILSK